MNSGNPCTILLVMKRKDERRTFADGNPVVKLETRTRSRVDTSESGDRECARIPHRSTAPLAVEPRSAKPVGSPFQWHDVGLQRRVGGRDVGGFQT